MADVPSTDGSDGGRNWAVLAIFFDTSVSGDTSFIGSLDVAKATETGNTVDEVDLKKFLDGLDLSKFYSYDGSIPVPPCLEIVNWTVLGTPQPITTEQLKAFTTRWAGNASFAGGKGNNRDVQLINGRTVSSSVPTV